MTTWPENRWFFSEDGGSRVTSPTGSMPAWPSACATRWPRRPHERSDLLRAFADRAQAAGLLPCLFSVTQETADHAAGTPLAHGAGRRGGGHRPARACSSPGKAWQDVRTALNQAAKQGLTHRLVPLAQQPRGVQVQVRAISEQWVGDKGLPEMGFTLGGLDEAMDPEVRVGLAVDADGTVHGVTSWMPAYGPGGGDREGWTLDVMRRLPGGFRYTMEFLIASACLAFQDEGAEFVSLSGVPLARAGGAPGRRRPRRPRRLPGHARQLASSRTTASGPCRRSSPSSSRRTRRCTSSSPTRPRSPGSASPSAGPTCPRQACAT